MTSSFNWGVEQQWSPVNRKSRGRIFGKDAVEKARANGTQTEEDSLYEITDAAIAEYVALLSSLKLVRQDRGLDTYASFL